MTTADPLPGASRRRPAVREGGEPSTDDLREREVLAREDEVVLKQREIGLREREVQVKERTARFVLLPALAAFMIALLTGYCTRQAEDTRRDSALLLEEKRLEYNLLLEAARFESSEEAADFVRPFVESGLVDAERVGALLAEPSRLPIYPSYVSDPRTVAGESMLTRLGVSLGSGAPLTLWIRDREVGSLRLRDGSTARIRCQVVDRATRRVRLTVRVIGDRGAVASAEGREGDTLSFSAPPPLGDLTVTLLEVVLPADAPSAPAQGEEEL